MFSFLTSKSNDKSGLLLLRDISIWLRSDLEGI